MEDVTQEAQSAAELRKHRLRWWTLAVVSVTLVLETIDETILNVALPTLQRELGASASGLQWMVNSYILVFGGLLLIMGGLGDRFGRARMLQAGLVVFGVASLAAAYVDTTGQLIAARAVMGAGAAMMMPATLSIIVDVFKGKERAKAISIWAALAGIGLFLGPVLGGLLLANFYWGSVFLVNVPIAGLALVATIFLVPDSRDPEAKPLDIPGAILSAGGDRSADLRHHRGTRPRVDISPDFGIGGGRGPVGHRFCHPRDPNQVPAAGLYLL